MAISEESDAEWAERIKARYAYEPVPVASEALLTRLSTPVCETCHDASVILIRIQYPDESAKHYCLRCRPLTFVIEPVEKSPNAPDTLHPHPER